MLAFDRHKAMAVVALAFKRTAQLAPVLLSVAAGFASAALPFALSALHAERDLDPMDRRGQIIYGAPALPAWTWNLDESTLKTRVDAIYRTLDTVPRGSGNSWREYYDYHKGDLTLLPQWATERVRSRKATVLEHHVLVARGWPVRSFAVHAHGVWATPSSYMYAPLPVPVGAVPLIVNVVVWSGAAFVILFIARIMFIANRIRTSRCSGCGYPLLDAQHRCPECGFR